MTYRILGIGGLCAALLGLRNGGGLAYRAAGDALQPPQWREGLLARSEQAAETGARFLCRRGACGGQAAWPEGEDPSGWLAALGQNQAHAQTHRSLRAPALIRLAGRWVILWTESGDRLEVVIEGRGSGVWPVSRFAELRRAPWWGPLQ